MQGQPHIHLTRRERQIMDIVYRHGDATAAQVRKQLPDPPGYSAVRAMLRLLEEKGHLKHRQDGPRYIYAPTVPRERARQSAARRLLDTFFGGSTAQAVATLLDVSTSAMSDDELERLAEMIERTRREGR